MTEESGFNRPAAPWGFFDILLVLALFFYLPGWIAAAFDMIPDSFRDRWFTIRQPEASALFEFTESEDENEETSEEPAAKRFSLKETLMNLKPVRLTSRGTALPRKSAESLSSKKEILRGEHPLTVLMVVSSRISRFRWVLFLSFFTAVITAPLAEEFVFRVVFQRGLEHHIPAAFPVILIPAVIFALIHIRQPAGISTLDDLNRILSGIAASALSHILILFSSICWLRSVRGAVWSDFGWTFKSFIRSFFIGIGTFVLLFPLMLASQQILRRFFPDVVLDPIPIFILAVGLGILFRRTNRFVSIFAMHASLNLTSFCGILWMIKHGIF